jgi:hypothetical protein
MRKSPVLTTLHERSALDRLALLRIPQPRRRLLALEAENAKVRAQIGVRISWIH